MALSRVGGYVLAGGKSTRMGRDKARLMLGGRPLGERAVAKLRRVCAVVSVLSNDDALWEFAPVVKDLHPGCGPLGGMEATLLGTSCDWSLFLPVDVPFVPIELLDEMVRGALAGQTRGVRIRMIAAGGRLQPAVVVLHREVGPFVAEALKRGEFKLLPVLQGAARDMARVRGVEFGSVFETMDCDEAREWPGMTEAQRAGRAMWFANVNSPEELAMAEEHTELLDTF